MGIVMRATLTVPKSFRVAIPLSIRTATGIKPGDVIEVSFTKVNE